jgi:F-type H+-transporting ATPase subunit gamma
LPADYGGVTGDAWNAPTVETDPLSLYTHTVQQWAVVSLYMRLLDSATAEHAARYSLMELATQNAEQIIQELTLVVQTARQRAITREMQELAIGAGMVGPRGD